MTLLYVQEPNGIWRKRTASLDHFQPEYIQRAAALWADPRIGDRYYVNSGSRSYAHQAYLYRLYKLHLGNLAALPGTSDHEYDSPGHPLANAADINPRNGGTYAELHAVAREYGFEFKIASELWHMTLRPGRASLPSITSAPIQEEEEMDPKLRVAGVSAPNGGTWVMTRDGGIRAEKGAPFYGSYPGLPEKDRQGDRYFIDLEPHGDGYREIASDGSTYDFGPK